ncbi:MAG: DUF5686 and carboxypeptidase regulatory-like domain-containing protein [Cyclobacteriaceae bacterium]|nr:carboxypeptidase-like regulatory domain-containing protein [Cyclobacteriaceae bacterium]MCH8516802.1 DUF5686 and carboxypeptidase regulatory-like domain-containing protein [Cyclobacteriaceae bacterium]
MNFRVAVFILVTLLASFDLKAQQGVSGNIKSEEGESLGFATIYVSNTRIGTASNQDGQFKLDLPPGDHQLVFQYMGFKTVGQKVNVKPNTYIDLEIVMISQTYRLPDLSIGEDNDDVASQIMRRAIAKAKFYQMVVTSFETEVYIKGSVDLQKVPRLAKPLLKREGIDPDQAITVESVSKVSYERPSKYSEEVISFRSTLEELDRPSVFFIGSFYENEVFGAKSPLAQNAFSFYRFELLGYFRDQGVGVNRIKVTPKRKGVNLFSGTIYIIDDLWSIHSLDLKANLRNARVRMRQNYSPMEEDIWMPTTQQFKIGQKLFGFEFDVDYVSSTKGFELVLDQQLLERIRAEEVAAELPEVPEEENPSDEDEAFEDFSFQEEPKISNKELKKMLKEYEKEEVRRETSDKRIVSQRNISMDSVAKQQPKSYWDEVRRVPLTEKEKVTYEQLDSLENQKKEDSIQSEESRVLNWLIPITGTNEKLSDSWRFALTSILPASGFNTVDGTFLGTEASFFMPSNDENEDKIRYRMSSSLRYAFARRAFNYDFGVGMSTPGSRSATIQLSGGRRILHFNEEQPISNILNSFSTLWLRENWARLFEENFVRMTFFKTLADGLSLSARLEYLDRQDPLINNSDFSFLSWGDREFMSNRPENVNQDLVDFEAHQLARYGMRLTYKPWIRYRIFNDRKIEISDGSPIFHLNYRGGATLTSSATDYSFQHLQLGMQFRKRLGITGDFHFKSQVGTFFGGQPAFMDFHHFDGNQLFLQAGDYISKFRNLDYYLFSTSERYVEVHLLQEFRQLFLTQIAWLQLAGINEALFVHYLATPSGDYGEIGYAINNIFNLFRLEVASSFPARRYDQTVFRIGVTSLIF